MSTMPARQEPQLSGYGRHLLAPTEVAEHAFRDLLAMIGGPDSRERHAFWLGVLLRDEAITIDQARQACANRDRADRPRLVIVADPPRAANGRACQECGAWLTGKRTRNCGADACIRARNCRYQAAYAARRA